jgi:hypothetical protein
MGHPPLNIFVDYLTEAATLLDHLDLVAVGIGDEEKTRQRGALMFEIAQRPRRQLLALEPGVLGIEIVDDVRPKFTVSSSSNGDDTWCR